MSREYIEEIQSQSSLYKCSRGGDRKLVVYYSVPDNGVNDETGLLLLIPGYGGHANSNVYRKMRRLFPDLYNLIVVQCDYFGWEFMQTLDGQQLISLINRFEINFVSPPDEFSIMLPVNLPETIHNFNDMGPLQAVDLMNSLKLVSDKYRFNRSKVIAYGHSHGAYLALLANILMPRLFSAVIDISAMVFPVYLDSSKMFRCLRYQLGRTDKATGKNTNVIVGARYDYLISKICQDPSLYDLVRWYGLRNNLARILSFQGADDSMVPASQKLEFLSMVENASCITVDEQMVDNKIFSSTGHGCGANYLEHFRYVTETYELTAGHECCVLEEQSFETDDFQYRIHEQDGVWRLSGLSKKSI